MKIKNAFYQLSMGAVRIDGVFDEKINLAAAQILKRLNYRSLADFFRNKSDMFATGEFWGKIVRAASLTYRYNRDSELKKILDDTIADMLSIQDGNGCISTVPYERQPNGSNGSDLWERKYVLVGLLSYYDITERNDVLKAAMDLADYTISQVGKYPKTEITDTGWAFYGIESSSILEPIMKLYTLTGEKRYLDFAKYIVESGACKRDNIFESIFNGKSPKDIGSNGIAEESIAKAYEMMSCFEGLIEYYRATGIPKWKEACLKFYDKLIEQEITIIGSGGADKPYNLGPGRGEQWNFTRYEQTNPDIELMMETCVTVTWIKYCYKLLCLTGDSKIADELERSAYNILLGAVRPDGRFFEYFPRFNGTRNPKVNYSFNIDGFDLSCCTANGPTALAMIPYIAYMNSTCGPVIQFYVNGSAEFNLPDNGFVEIASTTEYPVEGSFEIIIKRIEACDPFSIFLRVPSWCNSFSAEINGSPVPAGDIKPGSYVELKRRWKKGDIISVIIDLSFQIINAPKGSSRKGDLLFAMKRGPLVLTRDSRLGEDIDKSFSRLPTAEKMNIIVEQPALPCMLQVTAETCEEKISLIDYSSAGGTWNGESEFRTWIPVAENKL